MASLPTHHLSRLTTASRLARMRPTEVIEVGLPGELRTQRLIVRALRWNDREQFIEAVRASRPELDRFCPLHREGELDDELFDRQLAMSRAAEATGRARRRVAEDISRPGRIVAAFNLNDVTHGLEARAELSVWVRTDDANKGYAAEGLSLVLEQAFAPRWPGRIDGLLVPGGMGLSRVDGLIARDNIASAKLLERLRFSPAADAAVQRLNIRGREVEHATYSRFAPVTMLGAESLAAAHAGADIQQSISLMLGIERRVAVAEA